MTNLSKSQHILKLISYENKLHKVIYKSDSIAATQDFNNMTNCEKATYNKLSKRYYKLMKTVARLDYLVY